MTMHWMYYLACGKKIILVIVMLRIRNVYIFLFIFDHFYLVLNLRSTVFKNLVDAFILI